MKILIGDDSAFMRGILKNILSQGEFQNSVILEATNGNEVIDMYTKEHPDVILLDVIMPQKDGINVLKEIGQEAKVIVISAAGQEKLIEEAKALGAKSFISKPFEAQHVIETIKALVS